MTNKILHTYIMSIVGPAPGMMDTSIRIRRTMPETISRVLGEIEKPSGGTTLINYPDMSQRHRQETAAIIAAANEQPIRIKIKRGSPMAPAPAAAMPERSAAASVAPETPVTIRRRKPKVPEPEPEAESAAAPASAAAAGAGGVDYAAMKGNPLFEPFTREADADIKTASGKVRTRTLDEIGVTPGNFISPPIFVSPLKYKINPAVMTVLNAIAEIAGLKTPLKEESFKALAGGSKAGVSPDKGLFFDAEERLPYGRENRLTEGKTDEELNAMLPERLRGGLRPGLMQRVTAEHNKKFAVPVENRFVEMLNSVYAFGTEPFAATVPRIKMLSQPLAKEMENALAETYDSFSFRNPVSDKVESVYMTDDVVKWINRLIESTEIRARFTSNPAEAIAYLNKVKKYIKSVEFTTKYGDESVKVMLYDNFAKLFQ